MTSCLTSITAIALALEGSVVGRITAVVHAVRLRRSEVLEEVNVATRDGDLVASRGAVILDGNRQVTRSEKRAKRNNIDDSAIGHPESKELRAGRAVAVDDGGNSADAEGSSGQGHKPHLLRTDTLINEG